MRSLRRRTRAGSRDRPRQRRRGALDRRTRARFREAVARAALAIDSGAAARLVERWSRLTRGRLERAGPRDEFARGHDPHPEPAEPLLAIPGSTIARQVLWLAAPVFVEQSLLYLIGLSDTIVAGPVPLGRAPGRRDCRQLPALVPRDALQHRLDRRNGPGRPVDRGRSARRGEPILRPGLRGGPGLGIVALVLVQVLRARIVLAMNLTGLAAESSARFLRIVGAVTPLLACTTVGNACLRGAGDTRTGMKVMVLMNLVNIGLTWMLAVGWGPIRPLGLTGIAIGTACGEGIGGARHALRLLIRGRSGLRLTRANLTPGTATGSTGSCGSACRRPGRA